MIGVIIPYIGSKKHLVEKVGQELGWVGTYETYIEPFGGGFSLGLNLLSEVKILNAVYNDLDTDLVKLFQLIKNDPDKFISEVNEKLKKENGFIKSTKRMDKSDLSIEVRKYFDLKSRILDRDFNDRLVHKFKEAQSLLQNVELLNTDYENLKQFDSEKTLWFIDPPYNIGGIIHYYKECKDGFDHDRLKKFIDSLKGRVIITYNKDDYIKDLYSDYNIEEIVVYNSLGAKYVTEYYITKNKEAERKSFRKKIDLTVVDHIKEE